MFKNSYQSGFLSILYSIGSKPLAIWDKQGKRRRLPAAARTRQCELSPPGSTRHRLAIP